MISFGLDGRRALLIVNPGAGGRRGRRRLEDVAASLRSGGVRLTMEATAGPDHATELARQAAESGRYEVIFAYGGDGTLREAATGLLGSELPLAILPAGTANVLSLELGIPSRPLAACRLYLRSDCETPAFDVGLCDGRPFLMMASVGLDALALSRLTAKHKARWGRAAIVVKALQVLRACDHPELDVVIDDVSRRASFVATCNIRYYGGPFELAPSASPFDGRLDVITISATTSPAMLALALDIASGTHQQRPDVTTTSATKVVVRSAGPIDYQVDGDAFSTTSPLEIGLAADKLPILVPRHPQG